MGFAKVHGGSAYDYMAQGRGGDRERQTLSPLWATRREGIKGKEFKAGQRCCCAGTLCRWADSLLLTL